MRLIARDIRLAGVFLLILQTGCVSVGFLADDRNAPPPPPLLAAAQSGNVQEIKRLLAAGADPNERSAVRYPSPLAAAAVTPRNAAAIEALIAGGADPNGPPSEGGRCYVSPIIMAAFTDAETADNTRALLAAGADPNRPQCPPVTIGSYRVEVARALVDGGLRFRDADSQGRNALHQAFAPPAVPNPETVEFLVRSGIRLDARDKSGKTPLDLWREPRYYEQRGWFGSLVTWVFGEPSQDAEMRQRRQRINEWLQQLGAAV